MKKLMVAVCAVAALVAVAEENKAAEREAPKAVLEKEDPPLFWGFANYGIYSGYQLYGSIVNTEPTLQGYGELNTNLRWDDTDLGCFGFGLWNNSDLTGKRNAEYRRAFNEFDFNLHWQRTFWLDDDNTVGLTYRTFVVWYYYPWTGDRPRTKTTFDWDHYLELTNPYLTPYVCWVHEYAQTYGNLIQFGVKKPFQITDDLSVCPFVEFVWRDHRYGWCFSNYGCRADGGAVGEGLATMKLELDATYQITSWLSVFAKVAYCQNIQGELRDACDEITYGAAYGRYNEFVWGGAGLCISF